MRVHDTHTSFGLSFQLHAEVDDDQQPANKPITVSWEQIGGPAAASFDDVRVLQPHVEVLASGVYRFRVTVTDGEKSDVAETSVVISTAAQRFRGLILDRGAPVGQFTLAVQATSSFTTRFTVGQVELPFSGKLVDGSWSKTLYNSSGRPITFWLQLSSDGATVIGGIEFESSRLTLSGGERQTEALTGSRAATLHTGAYNLPLHPQQSNAPHGDGYARVVVGKTGLVRLAGRLPDGTSVAGSSALLVTDRIPLFAPMYSGKGSLSGELYFQESVNVSGRYRMAGSLVWYRPEQTRPGPFSAGFVCSLAPTGFAYPGPSADRNLFDGDRASQEVVFKAERADGTEAVNVRMRWDKGGKVALLTKPGGFSFKLVPATGVFSGTFLEGSSGTSRSYSGLVDPIAGSAGGYFLSGSGAGRIILGAAE